MKALFVSLTVRPDKISEFLAGAEDDSTCSVRDEPGCLRFDVLKDANSENKFYFYEVYVNDEAFTAHTQAPHYARWRKAAEACVESSQRIDGQVLFPANYK
jgi:autoinducer 2-degrading protein